MFGLSVYYLFILFNESTKSNPHSLAYRKIKKELYQTHAMKLNPPMKSMQTHATKSNLPMKLSTHAKKKIQWKKKGQWRCFGFDACQKKSKGRKGTMEIFWL